MNRILVQPETSPACSATATKLKHCRFEAHHTKFKFKPSGKWKWWHFWFNESDNVMAESASASMWMRRTLTVEENAPPIGLQSPNCQPLLLEIETCWLKNKHLFHYGKKTWSIVVASSRTPAPFRRTSSEAFSCTHRTHHLESQAHENCFSRRALHHLKMTW